MSTKSQSLIESLRQRVHSALDHAIDEAVTAGQRTMAEKILGQVGEGLPAFQGRPAAEPIVRKVRRPVSKETSRKRALQGQYMGLMRLQPKPVQTRAKKLQKEKGIATAVTFLKKERAKSKGLAKAA